MQENMGHNGTEDSARVAATDKGLAGGLLLEVSARVADTDEGLAGVPSIRSQCKGG